MKRKLKSICIILVLTFILFFMLSHPNDTINSVLFGINIWMYNVFPSLFPFFILSDLLINYGFIELLGELFKNVMIFFGLPGDASFPFLMSFISGSPSGAKYTKQLLDNNLISIDDANHLIRFTHSINPLFVIGTVGSILLKDKRLGFLILLSIILSNILIGVIFKRKINMHTNKVSIKKAIISMHKKRINNKDNFISILSSSIYNSIDILLLLLGIIIVFLIFSSIIDQFNINQNITIILKGLLEMTQGIKIVANSNFTNLFKVLLITLFLSFGGVSVHLQVSSIINGTKIKYKNFLFFRIIHSIFSLILVYLLFVLMY